MNKTIIGVIFGILSALFWAFDYIYLSINLVPESSKNDVIFFLNFTFFRSLIIFAILFLAQKDVKLYYKKHKKTFLLFLVPGVFTALLGDIFAVISIHLIGSQLSANISATYPLLVFIIGIVFFKYRLNLGILVGFCFIIYGIFGINISDIRKNLIGIILALSISIFYALEAIIVSRTKEEIPISVMLFFKFIWSLIVYCTIVIPIGIIFFNNHINFKMELVLKAAISGGFFLSSYYCYYRAIKFLGNLSATSLNILYLPFILIFNFLLFNKQDNILLNLIFFLGVFMIIIFNRNKGS